MKIDRVFVLLLVVMLPMTGCFDDAVGDADATDDTTDSGTETSQSRTWYSSGGTYNSTWNDGLNTATGTERCMEWGPSYDSQTGEYIGEECRRYGLPNKESDWNVSECTSVGGTPYWYNLDSYNYSDGDNDSTTNYAYRWAPSCSDIVVLTIQTTAGEAILLYEYSGSATWSTTCNGVSSGLSYYGLPGGAYGNQYLVVQGSSMNCTHELTRSMTFDHENTEQSMWSIVYAIQDVTVVS